MTATIELIRGRWVSGSDKEPDASIYRNSEADDGEDGAWFWEAGGETGMARDLDGAKLAAELAFYKTRCAETRRELRDALHTLESAASELRRLLERTP